MKTKLLLLCAVVAFFGCEQMLNRSPQALAAQKQELKASNDHREDCNCAQKDEAKVPPTKVEIETRGAPSRGPTGAPVTVAVFSDFQCPYCSRAAKIVKTLEQTYPNDVRIVFKNLPLPMHENASLAAKAALAAEEQGKFWEMHDVLFENQKSLDRASLQKYAQQLGLETTKFNFAIESNKFDEALAKDAEEAARVGARGTPTFFINGHVLTGAQPIDEFKKAIDKALKEGC